MLRTRNLRKNKKTLIFIPILLLLAIAVSLVWWHTKSPLPVRTAGTCSGYYAGTYDSVGPPSLEVMAKDYSEAIVIATVEDSRAFGSSVNIEDPAPLIRVTQVIKSNGEVHKGEIIPTCQGMGHFDLEPTEHPTVLMFLEGKDRGVWVPTEGYYGIAPQNKDGSFSLKHVREDPVTIDELQKIIK